MDNYNTQQNLTRYICADYNAPDKKIAAFIHAALNYQHTRKINSEGALLDIAIQAAEARSKCMDMIADIPAYPHIYQTDGKRYAISQRRLSYAGSAKDPSILNEKSISEEDLSVTCFLSSYKLAFFVSKATTGTFSNDIAADAHHNNVIFSDKQECLVRDENGYLPLTTVLKDVSRLAFRLYATAFATQLAICNTYLEAAPQVVGI